MNTLKPGRHMARNVVAQHPDGSLTRHSLSIVEITDDSISIYPYREEIAGVEYHDGVYRITVPEGYRFTAP